MEQIKHLLNLYADFTEEEQVAIGKRFTFLKVPAKHQLVEYDKKTDDLYFIIKGCVRKYCFKEGTALTLLIAQENQFVLEYVSFMNGGKSANVLETLEDSLLIKIKKNDLEELYLEIPKMNVVMRKVLEQVIYSTHIILNSFITLSPEERYRNLIQTSPDLLRRIPQNILASYLGISATSLSRIRNRVSKNG